MTTNSAITIFNKDNTNDGYVRVLYPQAWVHLRQAISSERGGVVHDGETVIRIPLSSDNLRACGTKSNASGATDRCATDENSAKVLAVNLGDYVYLGESIDARPPKDKCLKVVGMRRNFCGASPHIKLLAR